MKLSIAFLAGALALGCASIASAVVFLPENPGLTDAKRPALPPRGEELSLYELEERIRNTPAISALKKHSLNAEIEGLVLRFRRAHARGPEQVAALRGP